MLEFRLLVGRGRSGVTIGRIVLIWSLNSLMVPSYDRKAKKVNVRQNNDYYNASEKKDRNRWRIHMYCFFCNCLRFVNPAEALGSMHLEAQRRGGLEARRR